MGNFFGHLAAYISDGFRVWLFPVSTFADAAERELPLARIAALTGALMLVLLGLQMPSLLPVAQLGVGDFVLSVAGVWLTDVAAFVLAGTLLFLITRVFGGQATANRFFSAFLVFPSFHIAAMVIAGVIAIATLVSMSAGLVAILPALAAIGLLAITLIMASYTVLAARFGGGLGFPAAIASAIIYLVLILGLYVGISRYVFGEPATMLEMFGMSTLGSA